jgi:hypothetical protein
VDAWVAVGGQFSSFSKPSDGYLPGDKNMTTLMPATGKNMIAVGAYTTKTGWTDVDGGGRQYNPTPTLGQISGFSSLGPTRDNRVRPIISAPGEGIASALSVDHTESGSRPYFLFGGSYRIMQGTSQAAPHVTGIVALMLQAKRDLTADQAYTILRTKARKDAFTGTTRNNTYGDGKLDAFAYVKELAGAGPTAACVPNSTTLCLSDGRFAVTSTYRTRDSSGQGRAVALTADTGYFWFFGSSNIEVVVKLLNACIASLGNKFWVFAAGLTDVEVVVTVTDTRSGTVKNYVNPMGTAFQPVQDTNAFSTCP